MEIISGLGIGQWDERRRRRRRKSQMNLNEFAYQWRSVLGPLAFAIGKLIFLYNFFLFNYSSFKRPIFDKHNQNS